MSPIKFVDQNEFLESDVELTGIDKSVCAQSSFATMVSSPEGLDGADEDAAVEKSIIGQVIDESHFDYMVQHPAKWAFSMLTGKPIVADSSEKVEPQTSVVVADENSVTSEQKKGVNKVAIGVIIAALVIIVGYELYGSFVSPVPHLWSYPRKKKGVVRFIVNGPYKTSASLVDTSVVWWILKRNKCKFSIGNKQKELGRLVAHESLSFYLNHNRCYVTSVEMMENCRVAVNFMTVHETKLVEARLISTAALGSVDAFVDK